MRFADAMRMASGNMWRNKVRTILTIVAIFVAAFTITLTTAIGAGVSAYLDQQEDAFGAPTLVQVGLAQSTDGESDGPSVYEPGATEMFGVSMDVLTNEDAEQVERIAGVERVVPFTGASPSYITAAGAERFSLFSQQLMEGQNLDVIAGELPTDGNGPEIIVLPTYVEALGFASNEEAVGRTVEVGITDPLQQAVTVEATISGVMNDSIIQQGRLWVNDSLQAETNAVATQGLSDELTGQYMALMAYAEDSDPATIDGIKTELEALGFSGQTVEDQIGIAKQVFDAITAVLTAFGVIALLAASLGVVNTLFMSVQDRTSEIGLMKANGLSSGRVFGLFSFEALLLGLWGSVLGIAAAWGLGQAVNALAADTFLADFPGFVLMQYPLAAIASIVGVILVIAFLAGTLPARRAARLDPIEALRYE